jgi:hypothetical protein
LPFLPVVTLPTWWLAPFSITFWAIVGTACYHRAFALAVSCSRLGGTRLEGAFQMLLALAIWFAAPGVLLVANDSIYYEPVAMAYGLGGGFVLLIAMLAFGKIAMERAIAPLAVLAGLTLHARPHLAVGYYAGVCALAATLAWRGGSRERLKAGLAMLVLGAFGALLLASNALRFNDATLMHGSFGSSELQYGTVYWGLEEPDSPRAEGFMEHGQFNLGRALPNLMVYLASPPAGFGMDSAMGSFEKRHDELEAPFGYVRIEMPEGGTIFLWPFWMILMAAGLFRRELWRMPGLAGTFAVAIGGVLMVSYATITLRYHIDLWPLIALPAVFGVGPVAACAYDGVGGWLLKLLLIVLVTYGVVAGFIISKESRKVLIEVPGSISAPWSDKKCLALTARKGFSEERGRALCGIAPAAGEGSR